VNMPWGCAVFAGVIFGRCIDLLIRDIKVNDMLRPHRKYGAGFLDCMAFIAGIPIGLAMFIADWYNKRLNKGE
jgi:hypothetical protein